MTATRPITIIFTALGALVLLALAIGAAIPAIGAISAGPSAKTQTASVAGVTKLRVDAAAADVHVVFGDVTEATLNVESAGSSRWKLQHSGDTLRASNERIFCFGWCGNREERVTLTLPVHLEGKVAADLELAAGRLTATGDYTGIGIDVSAGILSYTGSAPEVQVDLSAGQATLDVADVREADLKLAAGALTASFTGSAPENTRIDLAAGKLDLTLPDVVYDVRTGSTAGNFDNRLDTSSRSERQIEADIAAGMATLRPGK